MFELEGEQYSLEQVTSAAEQSNMSLEDYLEEYGIKKLEEAVETVGKPKDVVEKDATVTSIKPEQASESMELEQVDTSLVSEDPEPIVSASEQRIATRKKREQEKQDKLKSEAILATNEIQTRIQNIPKEDIVAIQANDYFGPIKSRNDRTTVSTTVPGCNGSNDFF